MENEELIRRRMGQTREALTEKWETLEQKVVDSVEAVTDTVTNVKEKVLEGVETVKEAVDVQGHFERHPWIMVGGSVVCGYMLGSFLNRIQGTNGSHKFMGMVAPSHEFGTPNPQNRQTASESPSWLSSFQPELQHLKGLALGATFGAVREMLSSALPPQMAETVRNIVDSVTKKTGGEPIASSDWNKTNNSTT